MPHPSEGAGPAVDTSWRTRLLRLRQMAAAVAEADPDRVSTLAQQLGARRFYLAPIAWAAGTIVLLLRGVALLLGNWRLTLIQLVPAMVIWLGMYDVRLHALHGAEFRHLSPGWVVAALVVILVASVASFWCNTVFAYAIDTDPPHIRPAVARARARWRPIGAAGLVMGLLLWGATTLVPRLGRPLLFDAVLLSVVGIMIVAFVAVPARILERRQRKLTPKEAIGRTVVGWVLSIVAMTPGFVLDRVGLVLMGQPGFRILGFLLLSLGTALYAAGLSSVKAVKLAIKLADEEARPGTVPAGSPGPDGAPSPPPDDDRPTSHGRGSR